MIQLLSLAIALAAATAILGCGSGDDDAESDGPPLSKAEFTKEANSICNQGKRKGLTDVGNYVRDRTGASKAPEAEVLVRALQVAFVPHLQTQIDEIGALNPPEGDEEQVESFLDSMQEAVETVRDEDASSYQEFGASFKESARLARDYGLDACAYSA